MLVRSGRISWSPGGRPASRASGSAVEAAIAGAPDVVEKVRGGKVQAVGALVGAAITHLRPDRVFVDEVHRFSKSQQDALLPGVENRWVVLVAATTENPSFSVIAPLLSRSLLLTLRPLTDDDIVGLLDRAVTQERGLNGAVVLEDDARRAAIRQSIATNAARDALLSSLGITPAEHVTLRAQVADLFVLAPQVKEA